jgi:hypothetical protein
MITKYKSTAFFLVFSFVTVFTANFGALAQQTVQARALLPANLTGDLLDLRAAYDDRKDTRTYSEKVNYKGMSVTVDLGNEQNVIGVSMDHGHWPTHFPGAYKVEVAASANGPWMLGFEGKGQRGESKAKFEAIRARYIRVTATENNKDYNQDWTIAEIRGGIDPGQKPRTIPPKPDPVPDKDPPAVSKELQNSRLALDNKTETFATSGTPDYAGMYFLLDLGGEYELSRIIQVHGARPEDYPAEYKIEVSKERNESKFREVFRGNGQLNRTVARFEPVVTRYVKITALRHRNRVNWWSIDALRTNRDDDVVDRDEDDGLAFRDIRNITSQGLSNIRAVVDDNNTTRATTEKPNYAGSWVLVDLGGSYTVSRVIQVHDPEAREFPGRYKLEVSQDGNRWQIVFEGAGERGRSTADFNPLRTRYLRITATSSTNRPWSLYKLKVKG